MLVMIDNYDSFTYNLVQYFGELKAEVEIYRNDKITLEELAALNMDRLVISPGPCNPAKAGISMSAIKQYADKIPVFGVCLGHQSIGQVFGGNIVHAKEIMHGKLSPVYHNGADVFAGIPSPFTCTRYHSLVIEKASLPDSLEVTAWTQDANGDMDEIMGVRHKQHNVQGVQFHPESIAGEHGHALLQNFLNL